MEIYEYHLEHPKKSQWQVSLALRKANGKCHWLFALVKAPSGMPTGLWKGRLLMILSARKPYRTEWSIMHPLVLFFYYFNTFLVRLFCKYCTFFKRLFLIYTRPLSRKMHFLFNFASKVEQPPTILWSLMSKKSSTFASKFQ